MITIIDIPVFFKLVWLSGLIETLWMTSRVQAEYFSCLAHMEDLLDTESVLIWIMEGFIQTQEKKVQMLKRYTESYAKKEVEATKDIQNYTKNPINAFLLIKRLTVNLKELKSKVENEIGKVLDTNMINIQEVMNFPSEEDLKGAIQALLRIQVTYNLDAASIARGELNGVQYHKELTATDCLELGHEAYMSGNAKLCKQWMHEAFQRYQEGFHDKFIRVDALEYLAYLAYKEGNILKALNLTNELLQIHPTNGKAIRNKKKFESIITERGSEIKVKHHETENVLNEQKINIIDHYIGYKMQCRFEKTLPASMASKLKCRYADKDNAFLWLARVKEEELYFKPEIIMYHDVLHNVEIETIKGLALPQLERKKVVCYNVAPGVSHTCMGKAAWLEEKSHPQLATISKRVEDFTGLTLTTAEDFEVVNYGIGGHYEPHTDHIKNDKGQAYSDMSNGNRIATVLFYMSDVPQGGATVFQNINVSVRPEKGAALFWYNLDHNGEGYEDTLHGACPVLTGSKWIMSKWIHEKGQEFRKPCSLTNMD